jgi:hypothetical protein
VHQIGLGRFGLVVPLALVGLAAALVAGRRSLALFTALWLALCFCGLELIYWISPLPLHWYLVNSADRTVLTIAIGAGSLAPLLAADAWRETLDAWRARGEAVDAAPLPAEG